VYRLFPFPVEWNFEFLQSKRSYSIPFLWIVFLRSSRENPSIQTALEKHCRKDLQTKINDVQS
jgi:hypothetical protein